MCLLLITGCGDPFVAPAGIDESAMDRSADPCTDFYQYACGGYIASHPLGPGTLFESTSQSVRSSAGRAIDVLLDDALSGALDTPEAKLLRAYHSSCLDGSGDRRELQRLLARVDAVTAAPDLAPALAELHAAGADALFTFYSDFDLQSARQVIASVAPGGFSLPDSSHYLLPEHAGVRAEYAAHVARLSALVGLDDPALATRALDVETRLAQPVQETYGPLGALGYNPTDVAPFVASHPSFEWRAYFTATGAPAFSRLNVPRPGFFGLLDKTLGESQLDDLKAYLRWRALEAVAPRLDDAVTAEEARFHLGVLHGFAATPPVRSATCRSLTAERLEWELSSLYVTRHAGGLVDELQPMVDSVRGRLHETVGQLDWLDAPGRVAVRKKLEAMRAGVTAPADFAPYLLGPLQLPADFGSAETARFARARAKSLALIGTTRDRDWFSTPITMNATYNSLHNAINVPAVMLQEPLYRRNSVEAVKFGSVATLIAHELTHGFDRTGRQFDPGGAIGFWLPFEAQKALGARDQCLIDQYDATQAPPGRKVSGPQTVTENFADLGGVKLAYLALGPKGAQLESLTDAQTFFLAHAQSWCANLSSDWLERVLAADSHAPQKQRVNGALQNLPEFADAFRCRVGQPMAPSKRCTLW